MKTFLFLEIYALFYSFLVSVVVIVLSLLEQKYKKAGFKTPLVGVGMSLNKIKGKSTVLLPMRILSVLFLIDWIILGIVFIVFVWDIDINFLNYLMVFLSPTLEGAQGNFYFFVLFVSTILGGKGWLLISEFTSVLKDTSMEINEKGGLRYRKNIFF